MRVKNKQVKIYVTENERNTLQRKARAAGLSVSDYVRLSLIHSDKCELRVIDITPLRRVRYELAKQGVNLNQFMHWLNTYKQDGFNAECAEAILKNEQAVFEKVREAIICLEKEAAKNHIHLIESEDKKLSD